MKRKVIYAEKYKPFSVQAMSDEISEVAANYSVAYVVEQGEIELPASYDHQRRQFVTVRFERILTPPQADTEAARRSGETP